MPAPLVEQVQWADPLVPGGQDTSAELPGTVHGQDKVLIRRGGHFGTLDWVQLCGESEGGGVVVEEGRVESVMGGGEGVGGGSVLSMILTPRVLFDSS